MQSLPQCVQLMLQVNMWPSLVLLLLCSQYSMGPVPVSSANLSCSEMTSMMKVGIKVVRGKDWTWDNQDGGAGTQGTVTGINDSSHGWHRVKWAGGESNTYRMGHDGKCDLKIVQESPIEITSSSLGTTTTPPRTESTTRVTPESTQPCHQCACTKEMRDLNLRKAKAEAETAELAKEAALLAVEAAKFTAKSEEERSRLALEAAKSTAKVEEAKAVEALLKVEAAKSHAKAEEIWATNTAEELEFERQRRNQSLN